MFGKFLTMNFLFSINPLGVEKIDKLFVLTSVCLIVLSIGLRFYSKVTKNDITTRLLKRLFKLLLTIGLLGVVWFGARYENVKFFGSHFVYLIIILVGLVWLGFIVSYIFRNFRKEKNAWEKEQLKLKYINR